MRAQFLQWFQKDLYFDSCQHYSKQYGKGSQIGKNHVKTGSPPLEARQLLQWYDAQEIGYIGNIVFIDTKERESITAVVPVVRSIREVTVRCHSQNAFHFSTRLLITQINCSFRLQSYGKSRAKQKNLLFFLPRRSKFAILMAKLRKKSVTLQPQTII